MFDFFEYLTLKSYKWVGIVCFKFSPFCVQNTSLTSQIAFFSHIQ